MFNFFKSVESRSAAKIIDISDRLGRAYCDVVGESYDEAEKVSFLAFTYALVSTMLRSRKTVKAERLGTPLIAQLSRQYGKGGEKMPHQKLVISMDQLNARFEPQVSGFIESMETVDPQKVDEYSGKLARELYVGAFLKVYPNLTPHQSEIKHVFEECYANAREFAKAA